LEDFEMSDSTVTIDVDETRGHTWQKTADFRWNLGNPELPFDPTRMLEQATRCLETGEVRWQRVPIGPRQWTD
jgi:hypothetical protein